VEEVLAQAMQPEIPEGVERIDDFRAYSRDFYLTEGTPAEPTPDELARIEAVLDQTFPRPDDPSSDDDLTFFDAEVVEGDLPADDSPEATGPTSPRPPSRPDRPSAERGWFLSRRPRRGQHPR
jgi:hypothetical protein